MEPIKMVVLILPRGRAEIVTEICLKHNVVFHLSLIGRGTAPRDVLELWGLAETDRDVVLACVPASAKEAFMQELTEVLQLEAPGQGVAMCIPLSSVAQSETLQLLSGFNR